MTPQLLIEYLGWAIHNDFSTLLTGAPGIGKSDIGFQGADLAGAELILSHPVVNDPTDYKGLPFPGDGKVAEFLPFGDLHRLIIADKRTVFFIDDLGQASIAVQAACMQLVLARRINEHVVSKHVNFIAATNRPEDMAGVMKLIEPVKSRFTIMPVDVSVDDWLMWAADNDIPAELMAFIKFRPKFLHDFKPTRELVNTPSPRTIASVGKKQTAGLPEKFESEVFTGDAGDIFAAEYRGFLQLRRQLPDLDYIISNPSTATVPIDPSLVYAVTTGLARKTSTRNIGSVCTYLSRVPDEYSVACITEASRRDKAITHTSDYVNWAVQHQIVLN